MAGRIRKLVAVLAVLVLVVGVVPSAGASGEQAEDERRDAVAPTVDLLLLRPVALLTLLTGTVVFVASTPLLLITRPQDIGKPFNQLMVRPAKYVWADPLGSH